MKARMLSAVALLAVAPWIAAAGEDAAVEATVIEERAPVMSSPGPGAAFWFAPPSWTSLDLRVTDLAVKTFDAAGPLSSILDEDPAAAARPVMNPHRLQAAPEIGKQASGAAASVASRRIMGIFRPVVRVRWTPRFPEVTVGHRGGGGPVEVHE